MFLAIVAACILLTSCRLLRHWWILHLGGVQLVFPSFILWQLSPCCIVEEWCGEDQQKIEAVSNVVGKFVRCTLFPYTTKQIPCRGSVPAAASRTRIYIWGWKNRLVYFTSILPWNSKVHGGLLFQEHMFLLLIFVPLLKHLKMDVPLLILAKVLG